MSTNYWTDFFSKDLNDIFQINQPLIKLDQTDFVVAVSNVFPAFQ